MNNNKKYLASANTSIGFVNKFNFINTNKNGFTYILKGGPGTGKSTFMKKVGKYFEEKSYFVEYFYCSSDSDSLDGVRVENFSMVDGTAPHVTEATMPQIKESIVNVGDFISKKVIENKAQIEKLLNIKQKSFQNAYLYLESLGKIFEEENLNLKHNKNLDKYIFIVDKLKNIKQHGLPRELFCSYISPNGYKTFYKENSYREVIITKGNFIENEKLFSKLINFLQENNIEFIKFNSIFLPDFAEGIYINDADILVTSESTYFENFDSYKNKTIIKKLVNKISHNLNMAKINHKKVEVFYVKSMNFEELNKKEKEIIKEIEDSIK